MPAADVRPRIRSLLGRLLPCSAGTSLLLLGCAQPREWMTAYGPPAHPPGLSYLHAEAGDAQSHPEGGKERSPGQRPGEERHRPGEEGVAQATHVDNPPAARDVPVSLDAVLHLSQQHNARISLAREKLHESLLANEAAARQWLPKTYAGVAYYRHEGGIQNEMGRLIHSSTGALFPGVQLQTELDLHEATFRRIQAERAVWQEKGDLSKVANEVLLDAATTYVDLLAARRGEAIADELGKFEDKLLERARKAVQSEPSARALVAALQAAATGRRQVKARLRQQGDGASAKLAYLLGLGHGARLVPVDPVLAPVDLVDTSAPVEELVNRALADGPGTHELQGLLGAIHQAIIEAERSKFIPTLLLNVSEGAFAAGPGGDLDLDNRLDLGIQVRWELSRLFGACEQRQRAQSKLTQVHLRLADLHGQLAAGVREAHSAIVSGRQQVRWGKEQIGHASEAYRISNLRVEEFARGASITEVIQAIRALDLAHLGYVQAVRDHNKAQVRLLLLLGPGAQGKHPPLPAEKLPPPMEAP